MILVLGSNGFLGKRMCKFLKKKQIIFDAISRENGPDLVNRLDTLKFFEKNKPQVVLNCAAHVGGIEFGKKYPADIFHQNLQITLNILEACTKNKIKRLVNPISNCTYPAKANFFKEEEYWDGPMHESVMVYGLARKASWMGSLAFSKQYNLDTVNLIFSNMYGPEDHFEEERSHALGALVMKILKAKKNKKKIVTIWGTGKPVREWLHVDDAAEAMFRAIDARKCEEPINVGVGKGISIIELANKIKNISGYQGDFVFDTTKQDGADYKTMDSDFAKKYFNWVPSIKFKKGLEDTIDWYTENKLDE
jgi:GDP-L-fucose synthase